MGAPAEAQTLAERAEEDLSWAGLAVAEAIRAVELVAIAILVLLVSPPLLILAVVVIVPSLIVAAAVGLIALPVLAVRHHHRHRGDRAHRLVGRLARLRRATPTP